LRIKEQETGLILHEHDDDDDDDDDVTGISEGRYQKISLLVPDQFQFANEKSMKY